MQYGQSYTGRDDLPVTATGQREFAIIIPDDSPQVSTGSDQESECALSDVGGASTPARRPVLFELEDTSGKSVARVSSSLPIR